MKKRSVTSLELPSGYGDNFITLLVQSPYCIYAYWELSPESIEMVTRHFKTAWSNLKLFLRIYDLTGLNLKGESAQKYLEYSVESSRVNYYFTPLSAGRSYRVDLGVKSGEKEFLCLLRSKTVLTPPDRAGLVDIPRPETPKKHIPLLPDVSSDSYYFRS